MKPGDLAAEGEARTVVTVACRSLIHVEERTVLRRPSTAAQPFGQPVNRQGGTASQPAGWHGQSTGRVAQPVNRRTKQRSGWAQMALTGTSCSTWPCPCGTTHGSCTSWSAGQGCKLLCVEEAEEEGAGGERGGGGGWGGVVRGGGGGRGREGGPEEE